MEWPVFISCLFTRLFPLSFLNRMCGGHRGHMHNFFYRRAALMAFGTAFTTLAVAASGSQTESLDDLVVTATRSETAASELATAATVYTHEDIQRLQVRTLPDLLKNSVGLDVVQNGGYGQTATVFMRGTNSGHVLVLIDGIKAGSVTLGSTAFELIPIEQIERVEIIRGPQSSLYGSEAIGGVIQIFTRKGKQTDQPSLEFETGAGSYDTHKESGNVSGKWQNSWYNLGVSNLESRGFAPKVIAPPGVLNQGGYQNTAINARAGHRFDNNAEIEAFFMRTQGDNQITGYSVQDVTQRDFVNQVVGTALAWDVRDNWRSTLRLGQSRDDGNFFGAPVSYNNTRIDTTRWNASWLNQLQLSDQHRLTLGSDYRLDQVDGSVDYTQKSRYDVGVFGELHSKLFEQHFLNASLRWDENQAFGDYVTGSIGWRFNWQHGLSLFANFGNAFKAPSFNDLYAPLIWGGGNPNLKPEQSRSVETGLSGNHAWGQWQFRAYHTDIDNLIAWMPLDPNDIYSVWKPTNVNQAQIDGLEVEIASEIWGWQNKLNGSLLSPYDRTHHSQLINRANRSLSYDVSRRLGAVDVGAVVLAQGERFGDEYNINRINGFVTLDLRAAYHVDQHWTLSAKLNNVLDKHYQTVSNYNMADRNFFFTLHYNH